MFRRMLILSLAWQASLVMAIEEPEFELIEKAGDIEIRQYGPMVVARTLVTGEFQNVGNQAFRRLAGYIFGGNEQKQKISMTAPVSQSADGSGGYWITFMMPSEHSLDDLPTPDDASVELIPVPPQTMAVIRYRGGWKERSYSQHETRLREAIADLPGWQVAGEPVWARYNPPIVPSMFRRNEILMPIIASGQKEEK